MAKAPKTTETVEKVELPDNTNPTLVGGDGNTEVDKAKKEAAAKEAAEKEAAEKEAAEKEAAEKEAAEKEAAEKEAAEKEAAEKEAAAKEAAAKEAAEKEAAEKEAAEKEAAEKEAAEKEAAAKEAAAKEAAEKEAAEKEAAEKEAQKTTEDQNDSVEKVPVETPKSFPILVTIQNNTPSAVGFPELGSQENPTVPSYSKGTVVIRSKDALDTFNANLLSVGRLQKWGKTPKERGVFVVPNEEDGA